MSDSPEAAKIQFACPTCSKSLSASAAHAGRKVRCPGCQTVLMVPASGGELAAPAVRATVQPSVPQTQVHSAPEPAEREGTAAASSASRLRAPEPEAAPSEGQEIVQAPNVQAESSTGSGLRRPGSGTRRPGLSGSRRPAASSPRQRGVGGEEGGRFADRRAKKPASKVPMLVGAGGLVLAILAIAGVYLSNSMALAKKVQQTGELVQDVEAALKEGEIEDAAKKAKSAEQLVNALTQDVEAGKLSAWRDVLKEAAAQKTRFDEVDRLLEQGQRKPTETKDTLLRKRNLLSGDDGATKALQRKLDDAIVKAQEWEREALLAAIRKDLKEADQLYKSGSIEQAIERADQVRTRLSSLDQVKDETLEKRITELKLLGAKHDEAKRIVQRAKGDFDNALVKLDELAGQLPASNPDHEPLLAQLERFKRQVETEKKNFRRLDPADLDKLNQTAMNLARRDPGIEVGRKNPAEGVSISYAGTSLMLGLDRAEGRERLVLESGGQRFSVDEQVLSKRPGAAIRIVQRLGQAMQKAGVAPGPKWDAIHEAPFSCARRGEGEQIEIFYDGEVYKGKASGMEKTAEEAKRGLEQACAGLLNALRNDAAVADEVRATVGVLVEGAHKELKQNDYLPSEFCRRVLYDGYLENNVGGAAERYKTELEAYRKAYEAYTNLDSDFVGQDGAGNELASLFNHEGNVVWREYDKQADRTSFGIKHMSSEERALMYIVSEFAGKHDQAPADDPVRVRMTHPALGIVSSYDVKAGKFESDEPLWAQCAAMTTYAGLPDWMGEPHWAFPPHVVMIDAFSNPKAIVTPAGRVDLPHFSKIANVDERRKAQEAYLDKLAQVLNTTGLLHLYFVYFHQYVLDSPIETSRGLLGCSAHSGDIHQNVYESLDREMGGHYLGDCDDLAELYMNLTRRQGKLSFVMAVPGHATCGWVEKQPQGNGFRMQFLDTGPPRIVETETLDSVVEEGSRTYDRDKTMRFDPKSLSFLFRFAGEPTRTPYWLSTRMFVDKEYAEVMERVQSYWHFHFYALGVQTMEERIAKGDAVPENCTELAGLYGRVREFGKAVEWTQKALAQLKPDEVLTRINETARIAGDLHEAGEDEKAFEAIQKSTQELLSYTVPSQEWMRTISSRLSNAALMNSVGHPWEAYALLRQDAEVFFRSRRMRLDHAGTLTNIYDEMNKAVRKGKTLTEAESGQMRQLDALLSNFYRIMVFKKEDDFGDMQRNFAYIGLYYAAKYGHEKLREELLKDGPWPQGEPNLAARAQNLDEAEDWKWIRISLWSYLFEIGDALDPDKPESEWRKDDAIKLAEAMERAAVHARKRGSLASAEFSLLTTKLTHGFLTKNWDEVKEVLKQVKERDFARLTADVAEAFGRGARFVTPEEFETQYKLFAQHVSARPPFFNVVYEAYRSGCYEHARRAAKLALEHWKHDPLMNENGQREVKFLDKLIEARQKEKPAPGK